MLPDRWAQVETKKALGIQYLSEKGPRVVGREQLVLNGALHAGYDGLLVQEVHLVLGGVDVDVYVLRRDLQAAMT